ncbi:GDSL esterase/lipase [Carex littledalei]|uniref:GDSL esterase/lipase n=1 Tax=Carex littledalei TaxID=544730 RepID=A0A833V8E4_9POAL|nr:GDSL esterase/lipase [Carex littledalei]
MNSLIIKLNRSCPHDQRVVAASLVQATYILENDRENKRVGPKALAPAWWQPFNFDCIEVLKDNYDSSVFGCIYEFKPPFSPHPSAPRFVVTLRGTLPDLRHGFQDGLLDLLVIIGGINKSMRFEAALDAVQKLITDYETVDIWLAGHSLGASIATVTGKYIAKTDIHLKTFLFNPPFASIPLDWFSSLDNKSKEHLRIFKAIFKGGVSLLMQNQRKKSHDEFSKLATWTPYLFVNPQDPISTSYIAYFEERKKIDGKIIGRIEQVATRTSLREICSDVLGQGSEMSHLLPSASLAVNLKKFNGFYESHGIHQWWQPDISLKFNDYHYQTK